MQATAGAPDPRHPAAGARYCRRCRGTAGWIRCPAGEAHRGALPALGIRRRAGGAAAARPPPTWLRRGGWCRAPRWSGAAPSTPSALRAPTPARSPSPTPAQDDARTHLSPEQTSRCLMYGSPRLLGALQSIYGPDFVPFAESLALMQPDTGAAFQFHQDAFGLNVGIYLSPSTRSNGCLWAIPGSHTGGRLNVPAPASPPPPCRPR
jgi:hypothetical protein|eukprot:COSAG01_NODE_980_length_12356_cov_77.766093_13_plen_207_part_00